MKLNKTKLFTLIWATHLFIYHLIYLTALKIARHDYNELYNIFLGFIGGLIGWFEQIPLFFLAPLLLMLILIRTKLRQKWFISYVVSISSSYLINYLWLFSNNTHDKIFGMPESINLIYFIIPSLIISILCNWLIFKKTYKKLNI